MTEDVQPLAARGVRVAGDAAAVALTLLVSGALFWFGSGYDLVQRLRGDAAQYMRIATEFPDLAAALGYVGDRAIGMPLLDYLLRPEGEIVPALRAVWVRDVCRVLFTVHLGTSLLAAWWIARRGWITSRLGQRAWLVAFGSFPALIGHTTTPLSDTLAVDLTVLCFLLVDAARGRGVWLAGLGGVVGAAAILVRPSLLVAIPLALGLLVLDTALRDRRRLPGAVLALAATVAVLGPPALGCRAQYGRVCLQNPQTFDVALSAQMGLRGGRLLWNGPATHPGEWPIVPDPLLAPNLHAVCRLQRIVGTDDASLTGCLLRRPHLVPAYVFKKWVGLFDHFRFQPYVELLTPAWLRDLSRAYDVLAWLGLWFAACAAVAAPARVRRIAPVPTAFLVCSLVMLLEHTVLHAEDRYGLIVVPAALAGGIHGLEVAWRLLWHGGAARGSALLAGAALWAGAFVWQIRVWDRTPF